MHMRCTSRFGQQHIGRACGGVLPAILGGLLRAFAELATAMRRIFANIVLSNKALRTEADRCTKTTRTKQKG